MSRNIREPFHKVDTWVFDLDNTLYSEECDLFAQIDVRMGEFLTSHLKVDLVEARRVQKQYYHEYGTTLAGLMLNDDVDPADFLHHVHDIDVSVIPPSPELSGFLGHLPGRKFIFTNGDRGHAERAARQLGILDHFEDIFDLVAAGLVPKPASQTYDKFLGLHRVDAERAVMFEDLARNLEVPKALGMRTVLIVPRNLEESFGDVWEHEGRDGEHIDFVTDDLTTFLTT